MLSSVTKVGLLLLTVLFIHPLPALAQDYQRETDRLAEDPPVA